jgi:ubiquinol-cytochrome c reductase iron-sulfur subunit
MLSIPGPARQQRGRKDVSTAEHAEVNRRDFLYIATGAVGAVGVALTAWPFINQMNPDASVLALATTDVDLAPIAEGQEVIIKWRGNPVFVRRRTQPEIDAAKKVPIADLIDPDARNDNIAAGSPATDENRVLNGREDLLLMMAVCTHLGCVPLKNEGDYGVVENNQKVGGYLCPCHGSQYDTAGRVRKSPAPQNLHIPKYAYLSDSKIRIG